MMNRSPTAAFHAIAVARILSRDRAFMNSYKQATRTQRIKAVGFRGRNYVVVLDPEICEHLLKIEPPLERFVYVEETGEVKRRT